MAKLMALYTTHLKAIFWGLLTLQLVAMLVMSQDVGISADEYRHIAQASKVYDYYASDGADKAALEDSGMDPMQLNGQAFDNLMFFLTQKFDVENYMEMRHFFNALLGWLIILLTGFVAKEFWGYKGAILAVFLLFIAPRFLGHSLNNNKDIPFAFGFILSFYGTILFLKDLPRVKPLSLLILTLGIAAAISIRMAGLLSIAFLALFSAVHYLSIKPEDRVLRQGQDVLFNRLLYLVPSIALVGFFVGIAFWPFMMSDPIGGLKQVLDATASHPTALHQLFEGKLVMSDHLPYYYSLKWTWLTYPLVLMVGWALALLLSKQAKRENLLTYFYIAFAFVFVLVWMSLFQSNFYGAIRHLLFIYPLGVLMAVIGFQFLSEYLAQKDEAYLRFVPLGLVLILCIHPVAHIIRNYPYSYVYFNELSGGINKNADKYETDYFQHSLRHATTWFVENELPKVQHDGKKIIVTSNDDKNCRYYTRAYDDVIDLTYSRYYEKYANDWDYAIFYCAYIAPEELSTQSWPPVGTIHTETVDGFPIAAVVKRPSKEDLAGFKALETAPELATVHFEHYIDKYAPNSQVLEGLAKAKLLTQNYAEALDYANQSIHLNSYSASALWTLASALMANQKFAEVPEVCDRLIALRPSFYEAYYRKGLALKFLDKQKDAFEQFQLALRYHPQYYEAYMQMGEILINHKQYADAIREAYGPLSQLMPDDLSLNMQIAKCYHFLDEDEFAEQILNAIPPEYYSNVDYVIAKCRVELKKGNLPLVDQMLASVSTVNDNPELYVLRGLYAIANQDLAAARLAFDAALNLDSTNYEARSLAKSLIQ